jgi:hypothetical protein
MKDSPLVSDSKIVLAIITKDLLIFYVLYFGSVTGYSLTVILSDFLIN